MRSVISLPSFFPCIHRSLYCPALKLISVCLCRVQKSQAVLAQNHTRARTLSLWTRVSFLERLGATRPLVGRDPGLEARRWNSDGGVLCCCCFFKTARRLVRITDRWSRSVFSWEQDAVENRRGSHAVGFKHGVRCPVSPGRLRPLTVPSSLSQFWGTSLRVVVGLGPGVSQWLHRQAPAGEDAAQAGLAASSGLRLDLHAHFDVGSFPAAAKHGRSWCQATSSWIKSCS